MNIPQEIKFAMANKTIAETGIKSAISIYSDIVSLLGIRDDKLPSPDGADKLVSYIHKNMGDYTKQEVSLAFTLYVKGKLDYQKELYDKLSPLFVENVMQSYRRMRISIISSPVSEESEELTENEKRAIMFENIAKQFDLYRRTGKLVDFGNVAYKVLVKNGVLTMGFAQTKKCLAVAEKTVTLEFNKKSSGFLSISDMRALYERQKSKGRNNDLHYEARLIALKWLFDWFVQNKEEITDYLKS